MRLRNVTLILAGALLLNVTAGAEPSFWDETDDTSLIPALVEGMSREEKLAQLLLVGWPTPRPTPELLRWIRARNIGGVKIFGWNGENVITLASSIREMQEAARETPHQIPLFTATDQEGGWVRHVKGTTTITPGNMAIGATGLPYDAYQSAYYIGRELRTLGINMNFAPTVDVYTNPEAHVIGPRAFSDDPTSVAVLGLAYYQGLEANRVVATAKHFPGHGNAAGDSHGILPVLSETEEELWERDLVPYRVLIREDLPAILSGHLSFPNIIDADTPASLSHHFKTRILRNKLDFQGIVITDDLYMYGALAYAEAHALSFAELCVAAIRAGNDMIMLSRTPGYNEALWETLVQTYSTDPAFRARVDESVGRVLRVKLRYLKPEDRVPLEPDLEAVAAGLPDPDGRSFFLEQAARSVTVVADELIPYRPESDGSILLTGSDPDFLEQGLRYYPSADALRLRTRDFRSINANDRARLRSAKQRYDTIVFCLSGPETLQLLRELEDSEAQVIVFSILTPVYLAEVPWARTVIAAYGWGVESFQAGFSVLRGDYTAEGSLPIRLDGARR